MRKCSFPITRVLNKKFAHGDKNSFLEPENLHEICYKTGLWCLFRRKIQPLSNGNNTCNEGWRYYNRCLTRLVALTDASFCWFLPVFGWFPVLFRSRFSSSFEMIKGCFSLDFSMSVYGVDYSLCCLEE